MEAGNGPFAKYIAGIQQRIGTQSPGIGSPSKAAPSPTKPPKPNFLGNYVNSQYAVGNKTYNGSSPSPHAGPGGVNPAGYATRENEAAVKREGLLKFINQRNY